MKQVIWMFSGQGSQYYHMGRELYEREPIFRAYLDRGDAMVRDLIHESIVDVLYRPRPDRFEPFTRVLHTHPAILLVECGLAQVLLQRGLRPDVLFGYSLGELASWVVGEVISLEDALAVAIRLAEMVEYCVPAGGMLAILDRLDLLERCPQILQGCELAAVNFERSFVITGRRAAIQAAQSVVKGQGVSCIELPVAHPFHSQWTQRVGTPCRRILQRLVPQRSRWPLYSALRDGEITDCTPQHLWSATHECIDFRKRVSELEKSGPHFYADLGPSGSLATAVKYNLPSTSRSVFASIMTQFGQEFRSLERLNAAQQRFHSS
jgi:acyl transferase domain-containing protein